MKLKKAYIVMTHYSAPNPRARGTEDAWLVTENCEFVTSLKNRHIKQATIILDYVKKELYKTRLDLTYENYIDYLDREYREKMALFRHVVDGTDIKELLPELNKEEQVAEAEVAATDTPQPEAEVRE